MELEFDNEIDALMRKEAAGRTITIGEIASPHLDADEIAAFVENAVPTTTRAGFITHFAQCDDCRGTLSHAIALHAENAAAEPAGVAAPAVTVAVPWYRKLFLFPNLAYVMGGLVLLFAGFIGLSVLTRNYQSGQSDVSSVRSSDERRAASEAPSAAAPFANSNASVGYSANAASNAANSAMANAPGGLTAVPANATTANTMTVNTPAAAKEIAPAQPGKDLNAPDDEDQKKSEPVAAAPPPAKAEAYSTDGVSGRQTQDLPLLKPAESEKSRRAEENKAMQQMSPAPKSKGPSRDRNEINNARNRNETTTDLLSRKRDNAGTGRTGSDAGKKQVSGRTFEFRQGVWYDTDYQGQSTINIRRNTDNYRKLDLGLRGIAESFIGTVVTIWNGKAFRIQ